METAEARRQKVLDKLKEWNIGYVMHEHPPLPTIEEAMKYWKDFDSTHCKNLFFRNHKGNRHYLVILECHKQMDIHGLEHQLHQGKLAFASEQRMERCLGTVPGSVSLFGLINDPEHQVKLYLDKDLRQENHYPNPRIRPVLQNTPRKCQNQNRICFEHYLRNQSRQYETGKEIN